MRSFVVVVIGVGLVSGCKDPCGAGTHQEDGVCVANIVDKDALIDACNDGAPETISVRVAFDTLPPNCPWGEGDNLGPSNGDATARVEELVALDLPGNAVVCDLAFDFEVDPGFEQIISYDDNFFLLFGDAVLASSDAGLVDRLDSADDLVRIYDWEKIAGETMAVANNRTYCVGEDQGLADCEIPLTEQDGLISLSFDASLVASLSFRAIQSKRLDFTFVTLGDNDAQTDCRHEAFEFDVDVPYVLNL